eukprot:1380588-Amorphochlora_amoeboformis.AAC.1
MVTLAILYLLPPTSNSQYNASLIPITPSAPAAVTPVGIPVGQPVHHGPTAPAFLEPVPPVPSVPPVPPAPPVPVLHAEPLPHTAYMAPPPDHDAYIQPPSAPYMHPGGLGRGFGMM